MSQAEMVTVRMSRGHLGTPWGFEIGPKLTITNVMGGSLADRAGLLDNDILVELEGHQKLNIELARQLLSKTEHKIDLVVHRVGSDTTHQIWQPSVTENAEYNKFQHSVLNVPSVDAEKMHPSNVPLKVSLEHQNPDSIAIPGFNVTAQPFGDHQQVKHLQYNSPMSLYSPQSAAEQYLQQTGGLFGTDSKNTHLLSPNLTKQKEVPSYLRSETLRLIQESERSNEVAKTRSSVKPVEINREGSRLNAENITGLPVCFICGRNIIGPMCRASDCTMHGECFQCSTCGSALKNIGHHFINEKFYCDIHGQQQLRGGSITTKPDDIHSSLTRKSRITYNERNTLHAPYQPEIMTRQRLSISPTAWKTQSPISPSNRGVPPAATHYGHELTELKKEIHSSSVNSGHTSDQHLNVLTRVRSLPSEIRKVTSPRRNPFRHQWSPESSKIKKYWQYDCMAAALDNGISNESEDIVLSLSEYIKENEREYRRRPSPKRYLLRGEELRLDSKELFNSEKTSERNENESSIKHKLYLSPNDIILEKQNSEAVEEEQFLDSLIHYKGRESKTNSIDLNINESIEISNSKYSTHHSLNGNEYQKYEQYDTEDEQNIAFNDQKMKHKSMNSEINRSGMNEFEEDGRISDICKHDEITGNNIGMSSHLENQKFNNQKIHCSARRLPDFIEYYDGNGNINSDSTEEKNQNAVVYTKNKLHTYNHGKIQSSQYSTMKNLSSHNEYDKQSCITEDYKESQRSKKAEQVCNDNGHEKNLVQERLEGEERNYSGNINACEEHDKQLVIESITRYQQELHDQEEELSHMLDNTIDFLKKLDKIEDRLASGKDYDCEEQSSKMKCLADKNDKSTVLEVAENYSNSTKNFYGSYSNDHKHVITPTNIIIKLPHETVPERRSSKNSFIKPSNVHELIRQNDELPRDRAVLHNQRASIPYCEDCKQEIRGAYVLANGLSYCPNHFICSNKSCGRKLLDIGFVEEKGRKYCEHCFETEIAPRCAKCKQPITADCLNALQQQWHPHCFVCTHCHNAFGNSAFFLEQGQPYCEADWNALFTTKCVSCHYPIEAGDRWVEALGAAFHSNCFNCTSCNVNLEGENFYARNGAPYCKLHA